MKKQNPFSPNLAASFPRFYSAASMKVRSLGVTGAATVDLYVRCNVHVVVIVQNLILAVYRQLWQILIQIVGSGQGAHRLHLLEYTYQVVDADQVAVFVIADTPLGTVIDCRVFGQDDRFGKVNQPDAGLGLIVHKQQGAANHLVSSKEFRALQCGTNRLQTLNVLRLEGNNLLLQGKLR